MSAVKQLIDYILTNPQWEGTDAPILDLAKAAAEEIGSADSEPTEQRG
jgi:hypothetical protein